MKRQRLYRAGGARIAVAILFLFSLMLPLPLPFAQPAYAQQEAQSKDSQRLEKYRQVINGYLKKIKELCEEADGAGKEYIAYRTNDIPSPPALELNTAYDSYLRQLTKAESDFAETLLGSPIGDVRLCYYGNGGQSELFVAQKKAETKYSTQLTPGEVIANRKYLDALKEKYQQRIDALKAYCDAVSKYYEKNLAWSSPEPAPPSLFGLAQTGAVYALILSRLIPAYMVKFFQKQYQRDNEFYAAYEKLADRVYQYYIQKIEPEFTPEGRVDKRERISFYRYRKHIEGGGWLPPIDIDSRFSVFKTRYGVEQLCALIKDPYHGLFGDISAQEQQNIIRRRLTALNAFYEGKKHALDEFIAKLNTIRQKYSADIPDHHVDARVVKHKEEPASGYGWLRDLLFQAKNNGKPNATYGMDYDRPYVWEYYDYDSNARVGITNAPPLIKEGAWPFSLGDVKVGDSIPLALPEEIYDPDQDTLNYRWVIADIPEGEARSNNYVLCQEISGSFKPDLAGEWKLALFVNDGVNELSTMYIYPPDYARWGITAARWGVTAERHILFVEHSNGPYDPQTGLGIELQLYDPKKQPTKPENEAWGGPYYLQVAHERAGLYLNYADNGKPVDPDPYQKEEGGKFRIGDTRSSHYDPGPYSGYWGSTDLFGGITYLPGDFQLISASLESGEAELRVTAIDPKITELVISSDGNYSAAKPLLSGRYKIRQGVDHYRWVNAEGAGFKRVPGANGVYDWLEAGAARSLNSFPQALGYAKQIKLVEPSMKDKAWGYIDGYGTIYLSANRELRYNLCTLNGYGFTMPASLDSFVWHEAWHLWHGLSYVTNRNKNKDGDFYFADDGGPASGTDGKMVEYSLDSPENKFGPVEKGGLLQYEGDNFPDHPPGQKSYSTSIALQTIFEADELRLSLPDNFHIEQIIRPKLKLSCGASLPFSDFADYAIYHKKTTSPQLILRPKNKARWRGALIWHKLHSGSELELYFVYTVALPTHISFEECDASRMNGGKYVGYWAT